VVHGQRDSRRVFQEDSLKGTWGGKGRRVGASGKTRKIKKTGHFRGRNAYLPKEGKDSQKRLTMEKARNSCGMGTWDQGALLREEKNRGLKKGRLTKAGLMRKTSVVIFRNGRRLECGGKGKEGKRGGEILKKPRAAGGRTRARFPRKSRARVEDFQGIWYLGGGGGKKGKLWGRWVGNGGGKDLKR